MWPSISTKGIIWKRFLSAYNSINVFFTFTSLFLSSMREEEGPMGRREEVFSERGHILMIKNVYFIITNFNRKKENIRKNARFQLTWFIGSGSEEGLTRLNRRTEWRPEIEHFFHPLTVIWILHFTYEGKLEIVSMPIYQSQSYQQQKKHTRIDWISMEVSPSSHPFLILGSRGREGRRSETEREPQLRLWSRKSIERRQSRL